MRLSIIAQPYAQALFSWAKEHDKLKICHDQLQHLSELIKHPDMKTLLTKHHLKSDQWLTLLDRLLKHAIDEIPMKNLLKRLCHHQHLAALPDIFKHYFNLWQQEQNRLVIKVQSAYPLTDQQKQQLLNKLKSHYPNPTLQLDCHEEPSLIAGLKITINDHVIDGSLQCLFQALRQKLHSFQSLTTQG